MRRAPPLALLLALLAAGCAAPREDAPLVAPEAFDAPTAPWRALYSGGCGMCSGQGGFRADAEHANVWLLDDGRVVMAEFNAGPGEGGATRLHLAPNITFDEDALASLFQAGARGAGAEAWVVRVTTGRATEELEPRLARAWRPWDECAPVTDFGERYAWRGEGGVEARSVTCIVAEDEPFADFQRVMRQLRDAMRERGHVEGVPR